jgi:putative flippase GtrA
VLFAYVTNKRYVFKSKAKRAAAGRELALFFTARLGSYFLFDVGLYNLLVVGFSLHHAPVKIVANVCVVVFNYVASKWGIFKKEEK